MTFSNRRDSHRIDYVTDVVITHVGNTIAAYCLNIGHGGMFVSCPPLPLGATVRVKFELPDLKEPVDTEAVVRWNVREPRRGVGLQFCGLRAIEVWGINQIFRQQARD